MPALPEVERRSPGWHGPRSPSRAPTGRDPELRPQQAFPRAGLPTLGPSARPGPGGSLRPGPSRPSVGAHNTWAAWSTGFIGQKLSAEPRCTAARSRLAPSPSDLGWSRRAPTARSGIWVPKEPELEARRLFLPPSLSCPGARGEGSATLDFAHGCTVAAFGPDSPGQAGSALRARAK